MAQYVGVDIGGTKTRIMADLGKGSDLQDLVIATSQWRGRLGDFRADAQSLAGLLTGLFGSEIRSASVAVGAHGCENTAQCHALEAALGTQMSGPVRAVNDSELIAPAMGAWPAVGVVVGTGSIASARSIDGELLTAGGWGWLLGDEGSAAGLLREAVRAILRARDDGERPDALAERLLAAHAANDLDELALTVTDTGSAESWGRHAPEVFAAADEGSHIARSVIDAAGASLARLVQQILRRGVSATAVVAGGSVIERQPRLQAALEHHLRASGTGTTLTILDQPPVTGALALARHLPTHAA